jgi:hypothetical protein
MRKILFGLAVITATLPASIEIADAQRAPRPWCFQGGRGAPGGGLPVCTYYTLEQCRATIGGGNEGCFRNPALEWDRIEGRRVPPPRR